MTPRPPVRIDDAHLPVYTWAPDLEEGARQQAINCANLPCAHHHVAVMADGHQGYGVPIGAVLALNDHISPYAVGNDIGCGMALVPTTLATADILGALPTKSGAPGGIARDDIMGWVATTIPSGSAGNREPVRIAHVEDILWEAFTAMREAADAVDMPLTASQSTDPQKRAAAPPLTSSEFRERGRSQVGTLGSGNHFIELLSGPDGDMWLMLHSGSRGIGSLICNNFHAIALAYCADAGIQLPDPGLAYLPASGEGGDRWAHAGVMYVRALHAGLEFAAWNRRRMLDLVGEIIERRFPGSIDWDRMVNLHHNDATLERHFGEQVWVHRKGAVKASLGTPTVTPGSMGTGSYLGRGLGNAESFESCSHGAGRILSRGRARRELNLQAELEAIKAAGGKVFATSKEAVLDEMPGAYKDLDDVMANQADLVETVRRFMPLGTYKGAEKFNRKKRAAVDADPKEQ